MTTEETLTRLHSLKDRYYFGLLSGNTNDEDMEYFLRDGLFSAIEMLEDIAQAERDLMSLSFSDFKEFNEIVEEVIKK